MKTKVTFTSYKIPATKSKHTMNQLLLPLRASAGYVGSPKPFVNVGIGDSRALLGRLLHTLQDIVQRIVLLRCWIDDHVQKLLLWIGPRIRPTNFCLQSEIGKEVFIMQFYLFSTHCLSLCKPISQQNWIFPECSSMCCLTTSTQLQSLSISISEDF